MRGFEIIDLEFLGDGHSNFRGMDALRGEKAPRSPFHMGACDSPSLITVGKVPESDVDKQVGNELTAPRHPVPPSSPSAP